MKKTMAPIIGRSLSGVRQSKTSSGKAGALDTLLIFHMDMNFVSLRGDYVRQWLERLAAMGYNAVLWEVEDKVQWEVCPDAVWPEALTKKEFRSLLDYSRSLGLEPIPLLQTIGHAEYVLLHPRYHSFRELPDRHDCYCALNPEVRSFLKRLIAEYVELFGAIRYFHLGGDEAYVFASCPACKAAAEKDGRNALYADHMLDISASLRRQGIRPGIWCDMILHHPEQISAIPKDFIIWDWNYWDGDNVPAAVKVWGQGFLTKENLPEDARKVFPEVIDANGNLNSFHTAETLSRLGYEVILSSSSRSAGDSVYCGRHAIHAQNIVGAARKVARKRIVGHCVTSWAIRVFNYEIQEPWLRLAPLVHRSPDMPFDALLRQCAHDMFGLDDLKFFEAIALIGCPFPFAVSDTVGIQWNDMKDGQPAPPGFVSNLIGQWRENGTWDDQRRQITAATVAIAEGLSKIESCLHKAERGFDTLREWWRAGHHQMWRARIAQGIMELSENSRTLAPAKLKNFLSATRQDYHQWAATWMTPRSADKNTDLIHKALEEHIGKARGGN